MPGQVDTQQPILDLTNVDIFSVLSAFDEGVLITDKIGRILFYNETQARIDDLEASEVIGKNVTDIYNLDENSSMVLRCLKTGRPLRGKPFFYRTRRGKVANTIHSVFPLYRRQDIVGAVCFVKDYNLLEKTITSAPRPGAEPKPASGNGTKYKFTDIVGTDDEFLQAVRMARLAANSPSPVLVCGETGTGKEMFAQSIHNASSRRDRRFVGINCAAIPENLLEGLLFGTARGAFTGALDKAGIFEQAHGSTLFLDEVNSMPINLQAKLLRALQERKVRRVGGSKDISIDVKIISSVNEDPHLAIKQGSLRMDLFYRLGVVYIRIPSLRELKSGLETLTHHFIHKNNIALAKEVKGVSDDVMHFFRRYHWPGNVRELAHIIEGAMNLTENEGTIDVAHLPVHFIRPDLRPLSMNAPESKDSRFSEPSMEAAHHSPFFHEQQFPGKADLPMQQTRHEKELIHDALLKSRGNVSAASRALGISRQRLHYKMKKYTMNRLDYMR